MNADRANQAAVAPLLAGCPLPVAVREVAGSEGAVDVELTVPDGVLLVRLQTNQAERPAFVRTRSLGISYVRAPDDAVSPVAIEALRRFSRHVAARDPGGIVLEGGGHARRFLPRADEDRGASWSRSVFDANIANLATRRLPFRSAVLVVVQPCEMSCRFCPSGDLARAVQPSVEPVGQLGDLVHQLEAARSLGVHDLQIGGNDVLLFPRVIELLHAAGALGFTSISAQSPGQRLADASFAEAVSRTPLSQIDLPIYGATPEEHDAVTRTPGSFVELCRAIDHVQSLGSPRIALHTIALASSLGRLQELLGFGKARFGLEVHIQMLRPNRVGERAHLADAASFAQLTEVAATAPTHFDGDVPLCVLPEARARELLAARVGAAQGVPSGDRPAWGPLLHLWDLGLSDDSEDAVVRAERGAIYLSRCRECDLRAACPGVLRAYVDRFGEDAVVPFARALDRSP